MITAIVYGPPASKGSASIGKRKDGTAFIRSANKNLGNWSDELKNAMAREAPGGILWRNLPIRVSIEVTIVRPQSHYGAKGVKPSAPTRPISKPDCDKVARACLDCATGIWWDDDSRVVCLSISKRFGDQASTVISAWEVKE